MELIIVLLSVINREKDSGLLMLNFRTPLAPHLATMFSTSILLLFIQPPKQKSNGVRSGDLGGQRMGPPRPIHLPGKRFISV